MKHKSIIKRIKNFSISIVFILISGILNGINVSVKDIGAKGDGKTDDRAAIQAAIDTVNKSGGGTVFFPEGTYIISAPNKGYWQPQIKIHSNLKLLGAGMDKSIIKLADNQGMWDVIFTGDNIIGFSIINLTLDLNGNTNPLINPTDDPTPGNYHTPIYIPNSKDITIKRCRITNLSGVWAIYLRRRAENVLIDSCILDNIGGYTKGDFDVSLIRIDGYGPVIVSNNTVSSHLKPPSTGTRTAVELHGSNHKFVNNKINGFREALIVCSGGDNKKPGEQSAHQYYTGNKFTGVGAGFILFYINQEGMDDFVFENNDISIDIAAWSPGWFWPQVDWRSFSYPDFCGIVLSGTPGWQYGPQKTTNLQILNNRIEYITKGQGTARSFGISLGFTYAGNGDAALENTLIKGNTIIRPYAGGIYVEAKTKNCEISENTIIDPGQGSPFGEPKWRCGIVLENKWQESKVTGNIIKETRKKSEVVPYGIYDATYNLGNCIYDKTNRIESQDSAQIPLFFESDMHKGQSWQLNPIIRISDTANLEGKKGTTRNYIGDRSLFPNPEAGNFFEYANTGMRTFLEPVSKIADLLKTKQQKNGCTTVFLTYYLGEWKYADLPQWVLDRIDSDLETCREIGYKAIIHYHYAYDFKYKGEEEKVLDATAEVIARHSQQIKPVYARNADILTFADWGMFGPWGEMWTSARMNIGNELAEGHFQYDQANENTRLIVSSWLDATPKDRMICLPPTNKKDLYGQDPLTEVEAFSGSDKSRIGVENQCFLTDAKPNHPTYIGNNARGPREYLAVDGLYIPQVAFSDPNCGYRPTPDQFIDEIDSGHWDFIHGASLANCMKMKEEDSAVVSVLLKTGYKYRLIRGTFQNEAQPGGSFGLNLTLTNDNGGTLYNPRKIEIILRNTRTGKKYFLDVIGDNKGNRLYFPMPHTIKTWSISGGLPQSISTGDYEVLLNLPDPYPSIHDRSEFSIHLANQSIWETKTGYNKLGHILKIKKGTDGPKYKGENWFSMDPFSNNTR